MWKYRIFLLILFEIISQLTSAHPILQKTMYKPEFEYKKKGRSIPKIKTNVIAVVGEEFLYKSDYKNWLYKKIDSKTVWRDFVSENVINDKLAQLSITNFIADENFFVNKKLTNVLRQYKKTYKNINELNYIKNKLNIFYRKIFRLSLIIQKTENISNKEIQKKFHEIFGKYNRIYKLKVIFFPIKIEYLKRGTSLYKNEVMKLHKGAVKILKQVLKKLRQGASFSKMAEKYSDDEITKYNDGYLGIYKKYKFDTIVSKVVLNLKDNEISDIVKDRNIYHIFKVKIDSNGNRKIYHIQKYVDIYKVLNVKLWEKSKNEAVAKLRKIQKKLSKGIDFNRLLKISADYSIVYGKNPRWDILFGKKLLPLKKGDISDIIITKKGAQIVKILDIKYTKLTKKLQKNIKKIVSFEVARRKYEQYISKLISEAEVKRWGF